MPPLIEIPNLGQSIRRCDKVYGKKKGVLSNTRKLHHDLFGSDENELNRQLETLTIASTDRDYQEAPRGLTQKPKLPSFKSKSGKTHCQGIAGNHVHSKPTLVTPEESQLLEPLLSLRGAKTEVQDFEELGQDISRRYTVTKVGDGSYGDCFSLTKHEYPDQIAAILKVIPFSLTSENDAEFSDIGDVVREAKLHHALGPLYGFAQLRSLLVARGQFHKVFVEASRSFELVRDDGFEREDLAENSQHNRLFLLIEMEYAGKDVEKLTEPTAFQAFDVFWATTILLAKAEEEMEFEHRDLHLSNICYKSGTDVSETFVSGMKERPATILGLSGLQISIIDYTMSRAKLSRHKDEILFHSIAESDQLTSEEVDDDDEMNDMGTHQLATARKMNTWIRLQHERDGMKQEHKYEQFSPKTNVIWLSHVLLGLLQGVKSKRRGRKMLKRSNKFGRALQMEVWKTLEDVLTIIDSSDLESLPESAKDLLIMAMEKAWLTQDDVDAFGKRLEVES